MLSVNNNFWIISSNHSWCVLMLSFELIGHTFLKNSRHVVMLLIVREFHIRRLGDLWHIVMLVEIVTMLMILDQSRNVVVMTDINTAIFSRL